MANIDAEMLLEDERIQGAESSDGEAGAANGNAKGETKGKSKSVRAKAKAKSVASQSQAEPSEVPASTETKEPREGRHLQGAKKYSKQFTRKCRGCHLWFQPSGMGNKSAFCIRDSDKMDQLQRMAKAQGKTDLMKEIRTDEQKCKKVLQKYAELTGDDGTGSKKKVPKGTLFQSLEKHVATSRVMFNTEMVMMTEDYWVKHATETLTELQGRLTALQAQAKWLSWEDTVTSDPNTEEIIYDRKGKDGALRIAVSVKDTVHMANIYDTAKELHTKGKDEKNLTDVQIAAKKKQLFQHHESEATDSTGLASAMVRASGSGSAGNAFSGHSIDVSLDDLMPPLQDEAVAGDEEGQQADGKEKAEDGEAGNQEPKPKKRKTAWVDRDTAIASKVRQETTQLCTLTSQLEQRIAECQEVVAETNDKTSAFLEDIKVEKDTLVKRLEFMQAVMNRSGGPLADLIKNYDHAKDPASPGGEAATATGTTSWSGQLAAAPPCQSFASLTTLASWKDSLDKYWQCQSQLDLKELAKQRATARKPISELNAACGAGLKELKKAINNYNTRMQKALPKAGAKKNGDAAGTTSILFEKGLDVAKPVPVVAMEGPFDSADFTSPLVIKLGEEQLKLLRSESMEAGLNSFKTAFAERVKANNKQNITKPPEKRSKARAVSKVTGAAVEMWQNMEKTFPPCFQLTKIDGLMCEPCYLGVEAGNMACGGEPDYMASLRLVVEGTRTFVAAPITAMSAVFGPLEPSQYWKKFMDISAEDLVHTQATGRLYQVTCGKNEMAYLPSGWIFAERILDCQDMVGFTIRGLSQVEVNQCEEELQLARKLLNQHQKEEKGLSILVENIGIIRAKEQEKAAAAAAVAATPAAEAVSPDAAKAIPASAGKTGKGKGGKAVEVVEIAG